MKCPRCGSDCEQDEVDNGVCLEPCGPWGCPECHWVEERLTVTVDAAGDLVCQHGLAMDVHCCNCHNGFIFAPDHECEGCE